MIDELVTIECLNTLFTYFSFMFMRNRVTLNYLRVVGKDLED